MSPLFWTNAGLDARIPGRLPSNRLYFQGGRLIAVSKKSGRELQIFIDPEDPCVAPLIGLFKTPRTRKVMPEGKIVVDKINDINAARSGYAEAFKATGFVPDRGRLYLW